MSSDPKEEAGSGKQGKGPEADLEKGEDEETDPESPEDEGDETEPLG